MQEPQTLYIALPPYGDFGSLLPSCAEVGTQSVCTVYTYSTGSVHQVSWLHLDSETAAEVPLVVVPLLSYKPVTQVPKVQACLGRPGTVCIVPLTAILGQQAVILVDYGIGKLVCGLSTL